jgi:hypothetical protein
MKTASKRLCEHRHNLCETACRQGEQEAPVWQSGCSNSAVHVAGSLNSTGMPREKRYYRRSRIPESKFCELVRYFAEDLLSGDTANLIAPAPNSVANIFLKPSLRVGKDCEHQLAAFDPRHSARRGFSGSTH